MSEPTKPSPENADVVRKLVVPVEASAESKDGDRSPTKTERDGSVKPGPEADDAKPTEVIRTLVVPTQSTEIKDDTRTPTKTERGVDI
jgi:hypothetical protein